MSTFELSNFDGIDEMSRFAVFGFIRRFQKIILSSNIISNIPIPIYRICACYYYSGEYWDKKCCGNSFKIHGKILIKTNKSYQTAFLSRVIKSGRHHWRFKLLSYPKPFLRIGIFKNNCDPKTAIYYTIPSDKYTAYCICLQVAYILKHECKNEFANKYATKCQQNDIIDMYLDFNILQLSFSINDVYYGEAFQIDKCEYRAAINLLYAGTKIQLLSYHKY
eukprot:392153_1